MFPQARFVLVGRDGVINRRLSGGFVRSWTEFEFLPRAMDALRLLASHDYQTIVVSREEGVASGAMSEGELQSLTSRFLLEVALEGGHIHQVYSCIHPHEQGCDCRAPEAGLLKEAIAEHAIGASETFVISDSPADMESARALALPGTLLLRNVLLRSECDDKANTGIAGCLYVAVQQLLSRDAVNMKEALALPWPLPRVTSLV
jgi:histidinol-phosphate phosphatase family protein